MTRKSREETHNDEGPESDEMTNLIGAGLKYCASTSEDLSITYTLHFQDLLTYILENNKENIKGFIEFRKLDLQTYRYKEYENKTIIEQACINDTVTAETLDVLLSSVLETYGEIDCIDEYWYGWELIHYAASVANTEKLQIIVSYMPDSINSLTCCSENAFHILLNYELEVNLHNGNEFKRCTLIGEESENIVKCVKILVENGIDVNHNNLWNEWPICLALRYNFLQVVDTLLKCSYIDIDNWHEAGKSIRELLKVKKICIYLLSSIDYYLDDPGKIMFNYLKSGDETSFIHLNNGHIKDYVDLVDGNNEYNCSGTMLPFCFKKGFLHYLPDEAYGDKLTDMDIMNTPMLSIFCSKGLKRCIQHLLANAADTHKSTRKMKGSLIEMAAVRGYYPLVAILLQHPNGKIQTEEIFQILPKLYDNKYEKILQNYSIYRHHVLYLLLNKLAEQHYHDYPKNYQNFLNNILVKLNLENDDSKVNDSDLICQILGLGASMLSTNDDKTMGTVRSVFALVCQIFRYGLPTATSENRGMSVIERLHSVFGKTLQFFSLTFSILARQANKENDTVIERLHSDILDRHLDDSVDSSFFFYNSMVRDDGEVYSETEILRLLNKDNAKRKVFTHLLLVQFIAGKWSKIYWIFILLIALYGIFVAIICLYMLSVYEGYNSTGLQISYILIVILQGTKEAVQLFLLYKLSYFKDGINYPELFVIISCVIFYFWPNVYCIVISILMSIGIFFALLGQQPKLAKYTLVLGSIKYFLQYTIFYCCVFVSFALCFYIVFPYRDQPLKMGDKYSSPRNSTDFVMIGGDLLKHLFETLILFTGEFNDRVLTSEHYPVFGRITLAIFIFCMTIILNNLLVGLIVTDMGKIKQQFKLYRIKKWWILS